MEPVELVLWTQEGEAEEAFQFVEGMAEVYTATHPNVTFEVVNKNTEVLREDFQTAALAGASPDLLWTVNDHAGPFTAAELIQPVDDLIDVSMYVDGALSAVQLGGETWGVPITSGNHLMLYYNKSIIAEAPATTDELIAMGPDLIAQGITPLVYNQTEPFWLVPWLGGFGGSVFAADGVTPTLNTPEMVATLQFLHDIKYVHNLIPAESDYDGADTLFKEGTAAMIVNGDWTLGAYVDTFGENLGVARIPTVSSTGEWPKPYTSGKYFMLPVDLEGAKLDVVVDFVTWATNAENQAIMVTVLNRLPALAAAMENPVISEDLYLKGSADQMSVGTAMPTVLEMRCNWDSMKPEMQAVLADTKTAEDAALAMQEAADTCILTME
jgi:arabinogalactan oligomer/maltooligosaccharide transport system substrate-binding protein